MAKELLIRFNDQVSHLSANQAEDFLYLLQRNEIFSPSDTAQILQRGILDFQTVVDRFDRDKDHHLSFEEFATSPMGRSFQDLPQFIQWTERLGVEDIFQGFIQSSREVSAQSANMIWESNPTWIMFRAFEDLNILKSVPVQNDACFWRYLFYQLGSVVYFYTPEPLRFEPNILRYALTAATRPHDFEQIFNASQSSRSFQTLIQDESFFRDSVRTNPRVAALLPPRLLQNRTFLLSLCRLNFNVLSYLPSDQVASLWEELKQEANGNISSPSLPFTSLRAGSQGSHISSYPELLARLKNCGMSETGRLHNLQAAFNLIASQERGDSRPIIYLLYPDSSGDSNNAFLAAPDLDNLLLNSSTHYRFVYFEAKTPEQVFRQLQDFSERFSDSQASRNASLLLMTHLGEEGMVLSRDANGGAQYFNASHFSSTQNFTPYISGTVYLSGCSAGRYLARDLAIQNPGLTVVGPDRYFEGAEIFFDVNGKLTLTPRGFESFLFYKQ